MLRSLLLLLFMTALVTLAAQPVEKYDYHYAERDMISHGVQAILMCNGLFTSKRTLDQVFAEELAYLPRPVGSVRGGNYVVDHNHKAVSVGSPGGAPVMRAAYREGLGCVILAPDQTFAAIPELPALELPPLAGDPATIPWPNGDRVAKTPLPKGIDGKALEAASEWAFARKTSEQNTLSLLIVHQGKIIHERYKPGVDVSTKTRTWSTAKSIAVTLIGMLVDDGQLSLDAPLELDWLPKERDRETDPRRDITLRNVLNMSSGLYTVDNRRMEYATGSGLAYWAGASSTAGALNRGLIRRPGTHWDYENYDTLLGVLAMKRALGDQQTYLEFPRRALFDKIGMRNTFTSVDRFGDFIFSSQVYTNARDLARFGLLYLNEGTWDGEQLISKEWIDFVRTPAPSLAERGNFYGGQWWLVPEERMDVPKDAYATAGNRGQFVIVAPSHDLVIVRRGLDYGRQGFNRWDLLREVLKAIQ